MIAPNGKAAHRLTGAHIVHFAHNSWDSVWRSNQQIFSRLAHDNTVLYVDPKLYSLSRLRRGRLARQDVRQPRLAHERDGLWLYHHPVWAPYTDKPGLASLTRRLRGLALRQAMRHLQMHDPISWVYQPKDAELVGSLGERLFIFHIVDAYAAFRHQSSERRRSIEDGEQQLLSRADLVIVTSHALLETKRRLNPHTVWVPNGVDFAAFEQVWQANAPPPDDIARLPRPVIGYSGHISLRLNLPLLVEVARRRPGWSLALVGSVWDKGCEAELASLQALPNVHFLGVKPVEQVPAYIGAFDAGLIPYHSGEEARNINPIKLYEYLAMGKPVVSIDLPALDGFRHALRVADSPETFVTQLAAALAENDPGLIAERRRLAAENTWDQRADQISRLVQARLDTLA